MRSATTPELAVLAATTRAVTWRVKVANGSGTMIDLSSWVLSVKIDRDVDQPVDGCTIQFVRANGSTQSLSPLRTDSTLNVKDDLTYAPQLDLNRSVTVEVATTAIGTAPVAGDYKMLFKGTIDVVNFEHDPIVCVCRDLGAPLVDRWIETEAFYGSGPGIAIQTVMQSIIDAVFGGGVYTLYTPVSPGFNIVTYRQQKMSVFDALQDLVQLIGWDVRFRWDDGSGTFRLTLSEPPRTKTTPDYTFSPSAYHDITDLSLDVTNIRNVISGDFRDANNFGNRTVVTVSDATSISKYGRRFFLIQEADISPIDSSSEMTTMITAALADLKDPKADQEVEMPFHWPADLWDLYRYSNNSVHYNTNQDIAVVELSHELALGSHRTRVRVRGTPIGQYITWRGRDAGPIGGPTTGGGQAFAPYPFIAPLNTEANDMTWDLRFNALNGSGGGGTNLTYVIKSKASFGTESTLDSGNASAFPLTVSVTRYPKLDQVITFTVTDAATGMFRSAYFTVPAIRPEIDNTGTTFSANVADSIGRLINKGFHKVSSADPDNFSSILDGGGYAKTTTNEKTGAGRAFGAIDSGGKVFAPKFFGTSAAPTLSSPDSFWNGTNAIVGTDAGGKITLDKSTTSSSQHAGHQIKVTFAVAYPAAPFVVLSVPNKFTSNLHFELGDVTAADFWIDANADVLLFNGTVAQQRFITYNVIG